jgi:hypothetical protein
LYTEIQKYIIDEIEEQGEVGFYLLIPVFLKRERGIDLVNPIYDHKENYQISKEDFHLLKEKVKQVITDYNLGLFRPKKDDRNEPTTWDDCFDILSEDQTAFFLNDENFWTSSNKEYYVLSTK